MARNDFKELKEGNWTFSQFCKTPNVIIAETKQKWYDEARLKRIIEQLGKHNCRAFINTTEDNPLYAKRRKTFRLEIYMKCDTKDLQEQIRMLKKIIPKTLNNNRKQMSYEYL